MRNCARLGGGSTKEVGESESMKGNEKRGRTEIGVVASEPHGAPLKLCQVKAERVRFVWRQTKGDRP